jgi:hypothetical protein
MMKKIFFMVMNYPVVCLLIFEDEKFKKIKDNN